MQTSKHITEIKKEGLEITYKVVVSSEELNGKIQTQLEEIARDLKMPGFSRPGKVPMNIVAQRYGYAVH